MWPQNNWLIALLIFSQNSSSLNIFSTREGSTVKKIIKKNVCNKVLLEKKMIAEVH